MMHTPGPWRCVPNRDDAYYLLHIETVGVHIASIVGRTERGVVCDATAANARLIEHAPDLAAVLAALLTWDQRMGGWDAACWERARRTLHNATGEAATGRDIG